MTKNKILIGLLLFIFAISSCCFATDEVPAEGETLSADALTALLSGVTASSEDVSTQETTTATDNSNWTNSDLYKMDQTVVIDGVVDGNAYVMAKEVTVKGEIGGDLFVMAETINIDGGYIYSSIFAMANEIKINGIAYDLYAACNKLTLEENGLIYRDMRVTATEVNLNGRVRRDAYITSPNLNFSTTSGTIIYGNLEFSSNQAEYTAPEGVVAGEVKYTATNFDEVKQISVGTIILKYVTDLFKNLVLTFVVIMLLLWITPKFFEKVENMSVGKTFASLGIGFLVPIVLTIVGIMLLIIGIGSKVVLTAAFAYMFITSIAFAVTVIYFTKLLSKKVKMESKVKFILFALLIAAALWLVDQLPFIGGLVSFLSWAFGTGIIFVNILPKKVAKEENK